MPEELISVKNSKSTNSPNFSFKAQISTTEYIWDTLHGNIKWTSSSGELLHKKLPKRVFQNMRQLWAFLQWTRIGRGGWKITINTKNYWKWKKTLCVRLRSGDKHYLRKSADRKAQISPVNVFGNDKLNSAPSKRGERGAKFWQGKVQKSSPISALLRWRHFRLSLSLSLSLSLYLSPIIKPANANKAITSRFVKHEIIRCFLDF